MKPASLYTIRHINLKSLLRQRQEVTVSGKEYLVYWWDDIPLGHYWSDNPDHTVFPYSAIWKIINPTLNFYCASAPNTDFGKLVDLQQEAEYDLFTRLLEGLFDRYAADAATGPDDLSLIICTRNRTAQLKSCLEALAGQSVPPAEVIVVDNAPDDQSTRDLVAAFPDVKYVLEPEKGLDRARNTGWQHATCNIVAYTDDDVRLHRDFVWQTVKAFGHPRVQAVTGLVLAEELDTIAQVLFEKYWSFNRGYQDIYYGTDYFKKHFTDGVPVWNIGAGANMAFRRVALQDAGGFDERLDVGASGCNGDSEMWYRLLAAGWAIHYSPRSIAYHTHRTEMSALKRQIYYYLRGNISSVLVQYQRSRHRGNLHYLFKTLPAAYANSIWQKVRMRYLERYTTLTQELKGGLSGICYFINHRKIPIATFSNKDKFRPVAEPSVSVIITTYNHGRYIHEAIESVLQQHIKPAEIIVIDDGSTDNTKDIVLRYPQVTYFYQTNRGLSAARNTGIFHSRGNFVIFLDADDRLYPDAIAVNLRYFEQHPSCAFISGGHDKVDDNNRLVESDENKKIPERDLYAALLRSNYIGMHGAVMYRREIFNHFLFDETLSACEDYDLYLRIAKKYPVFSHGEKLAAYRIHAGNMSKDIELMLKQVKNVLQKNADLHDVTTRNDYRAGIKNWTDYYTNKMFHRIANRYLYPGYKHNARDHFFVAARRPVKMAKFYGRRIIGMLERTGKVKRPGRVSMGDLRRTTPLSRNFGYDRGGPVDRYYIENFLKENAVVIRGVVLEIGDNDYTVTYGGEKVEKSDILFINDSNPKATIIGDLSAADHIPDETFDCIILTQTLHLIYDFDAAIKHCYRILKGNGVLLLTVPGISQIDYGEWHDTWYWSFTDRSIQRLLTKYFNAGNIQVNTYGNVLAATSFLYGMGKNEIEERKLDQTDNHYQVIVTAKATKH